MLLYYYPNRPTLIPADAQNPMNPTSTSLDELEKSRRWVAEQKWNGDNALIYTNTDPPTFWNRTHGVLKYKPTSVMLNQLKCIPKNSVVNGELVHSKTKTVKNLLVLHCIMAWDGKLLLGKTWGYSRHLLEGLGLPPQGQFNDGVVVSRVWKTGFWNLFQAADGKIIEGIVLKDPKGKLVFSTSPVGDVSWMLKVRKPCAKYNY